MNRIVVGVDGSPGKQAATDFAVAEAALRGSSVQALHSWQCPIVYSDRGWVTPLAEFVGLLLGTVTLHRVTHAGCPVVVVREPVTPRGGGSS